MVPVQTASYPSAAESHDRRPLSKFFLLALRMFVNYLAQEFHELCTCTE